MWYYIEWDHNKSRFEVRQFASVASQYQVVIGQIIGLKFCLMFAAFCQIDINENEHPFDVIVSLFIWFFVSLLETEVLSINYLNRANKQKKKRRLFHFGLINIVLHWNEHFHWDFELNE